jgi:hypothetical protein
MARNVYFTQGTANEQYLLEDLIVESIQIWGQDFTYIPRTLVAKDEILGEDRLSTFNAAFPIEMYLESVDGFEGQGAMIQKFGLMMEQSATLTVSRRRWEQLVGRLGYGQLPNRPSEGDLLYFPLTGGLFEIKFVQHQDPFYQLGKLYVYKLSVELFQYSSERITTGIPEIDVFETLKSFTTDMDMNLTGGVRSVTITNGGSGYTMPPVVTVHGIGIDAELVAHITAGSVTSITISNPGSRYLDDSYITMTGNATATAVFGIDIDVPQSYGDNNKFAAQASEFTFDSGNPFDEVIYTPIVHSADSTIIHADSNLITVDTI